MRLTYVILLALFTFVVGAVLATCAVLAVRGARPVQPRQDSAADKTVVALVARKAMTKWATVKQPDQEFEARVILPSEAPADLVPAANIASLKGRFLRGNLSQGAILTANDLLEPTVQPVTVLVAQGKMTQWSSIREPEAQLEACVLPSIHVPANFIAPEKLADLKGRRLRRTIAADAVLSEDDLLRKEVSGIDGMLEKGKTAISIPISADRAVAFFVVPGSKVDVIHTVDGVHKVLLENVLVLAIDLSTGRFEGGPGAPRPTATLQMDNAEQSKKVTAARERGTLSLVMRPPDADDDKDKAKAKDK